MISVPNAVEILRKIWTACVGRTSITDDRQTDGRTIANTECEREFTFAKNWSFCVKNDIEYYSKRSVLARISLTSINCQHVNMLRRQRWFLYSQKSNMAATGNGNIDIAINFCTNRACSISIPTFSGSRNAMVTSKMPWDQRLVR